MNDIPKPDGSVLRRNPERECGTPVGQIHAAVKGLPGFQTISFYCNLDRLHQGECMFIGNDVVVRANRTTLPGDPLLLRRKKGQPRL